MKLIPIDQLTETAAELQRVAKALEDGMDRLVADSIINAHGKFIQAFVAQTKWEVVHGHTKQLVTKVNDRARTTTNSRS